MKNILISLIAFLMIAPALCFAIEGKVVGVSDGDTVTILTGKFLLICSAKEHNVSL